MISDSTLYRGFNPKDTKKSLAAAAGNDFGVLTRGLDKRIANLVEENVISDNVYAFADAASKIHQALTEAIGYGEADHAVTVSLDVGPTLSFQQESADGPHRAQVKVSDEQGHEYWIDGDFLSICDRLEQDRLNNPGYYKGDSCCKQEGAASAAGAALLDLLCEGNATQIKKLADTPEWLVLLDRPSCAERILIAQNLEGEPGVHVALREDHVAALQAYAKLLKSR
ncbi:hypothetical protein [Chromobacterium amazonense]|uniref:hypothetical protein n=1 Tax=Chromobacterium amazonense TaxID=1382803 RepID=UPI003F7AD945